MAAAVLMCVNIVFLAFALADQGLASLLGGYTHSGGPFYLGIGVLVLSVLLFFYRRAVQDKQPLTLRDRDVPTMPTKEQMALLEEEGFSA